MCKCGKSSHVLPTRGWVPAPLQRRQSMPVLWERNTTPTMEVGTGLRSLSLNPLNGKMLGQIPSIQNQRHSYRALKGQPVLPRDRQHGMNKASFL